MLNPFLSHPEVSFFFFCVQITAKVYAKVGKIAVRLRRHLRRWGGRTCTSAKSSSGRQPCGCQGDKKQPRLHVSLSLAVISARVMCMIASLSAYAATSRRGRSGGEMGRPRVHARRGEGKQGGGNRNKLQALTYILESCKQFGCTDVPPIPVVPETLAHEIQPQQQSV